MAQGHASSARIVTASAGNHGRALAWAAATAGIPLTVYAPREAPRSKLDAIRAAGADLQLCSNYDEAERQAKANAADRNAEFVSPYSHRDVIAGAGTVGLEIVEDWRDVDAIVVPIGGGGLISGIAIAAKALRPEIDVIGVEVEASSPFTRGLAAGHIVPIDVGETLADGLAGNLDPDTVTFDLVRNHVHQIALVGEPALSDAIAGIVLHERLIAEGAGAVGVAAITSERLTVRGRRIAVVLSGANIDSSTLAAVLARVT